MMLIKNPCPGSVKDFGGSQKGVSRRSSEMRKQGFMPVVCAFSNPSGESLMAATVSYLFVLQCTLRETLNKLFNRLPRTRELTKKLPYPISSTGLHLHAAVTRGGGLQFGRASRGS